VAAAFMLLTGVAAGAVQAVRPIKTLVDGPGTSLYGTAWSSSVTSYVLLAAAIALFGGIVYWAPKLIGRTLAEGPAKGIAALLLVGTIVWSLPELLSGLFGQPGAPGATATDNVDLLENLSLVSTVGAVLLGLAVAGFIALFLQTASRGAVAGDDPWSGHTLEWATSSPPPLGNFASLPKVSSEAPLYDARHRPEEASA
jgi:heme/copper-type cytochrome/quinol oxidase subunit 1